MDRIGADFSDNNTGSRIGNIQSRTDGQFAGNGGDKRSRYGITCAGHIKYFLRNGRIIPNLTVFTDQGNPHFGARDHEIAEIIQLVQGYRRFNDRFRFIRYVIPDAL